VPWRNLARRVKERVAKDNLRIIAGGTAFFLLLGMVPGLAALISIYGLVANPSDIQAQFAALAGVLPTEVRSIFETQMRRIAEQRQAAGLAAFVSIALALWGGSAAMKSVMNALNIIYDQEEKRGFVKLTLTALGLTFGLILLGLVAIGLIVVLPPILGRVGWAEGARTTVSLLRWPFLIVVALAGSAAIYRYGPSRERVAWRVVLPGAVVATLVWVAGSMLFGLYTDHFGRYNKTYGSLGAIVVLMTWLLISAFGLLLGGEVNAEREQSSRQPAPPPPGRDGSSGSQLPPRLGSNQGVSP
jgi:membrane protein